ncbi:MAG: VWA domain-containing protein [Gammaproteobacteria bacterium]|nr:VWA domain-containing protein [Gammaproteobacteria bacterium]
MWQLAWPWMLLLLPVPWLIRRYASPDPMDKDAALRVPLAGEFATATGTGRLGGPKPWRLVLLSAIWLLVVLAAARPQHVGEPIALPMTGRDLLMAVDLSGSMEERDFQLNGEWVDRLTATKAVARDFIERRVGDRIGLILFGRETYLQTPLTFDRATVQTLLDEAVIGLAGTETAIGDSIGLAIKTLSDAEIDEGRRVLILLTDGANTAGAVEPLKAAELARQRGMVIYTIGIGADAVLVRSLFGVRQVNPSADLDEETLTTIAEGTGGAYFRARDIEGFQRIYEVLDELEPAATDESGFRPIVEHFYWPLAGAALIVLAWAFAGVLTPERRARPSVELGHV